MQQVYGYTYQYYKKGLLRYNTDGWNFGTSHLDLPLIYDKIGVPDKNYGHEYEKEFNTTQRLIPFLVERGPLESFFKRCLSNQNNFIRLYWRLG